MNFSQRNRRRCESPAGFNHALSSWSLSEKRLTVPTYTVRLYMAGDIATAKQTLRRECYPPNRGLCVTVEPTTFIYTGGEEEGFVVGLLNYPRFPSNSLDLWARAETIARALLDTCCQWSVLLVAENQTTWITRRPEEQAAQPNT